MFVTVSQYAAVPLLGTECEQISPKPCDLQEIKFRYFKFQMLK